MTGRVAAARTGTGSDAAEASGTGSDAAEASGTRATASDAGASGSLVESGLDRALARVGDRWSLLVVATLLDGPRRFGDLEAEVPGIAPNTLVDRLRRLERAGLVRSTPYSSRPIRLSYALTADGAELAGALRLLADWGARSEDRPEALRHEACGTPLEARWYCPTCARAVDDAERDTTTLV